MESTAWYFAYGSNMCSSVFLQRRGIVPLHSQVMKIPGYVLCFDHLGVPYREPAMGSIRQKKTWENTPEVIGVAYNVTSADISRMVASEGGGISYKLVCLEAYTSTERTGLKILTLITKSPACCERRPTKRYMSLILQGAVENSLPPEYCNYLARLPTFEQKSSQMYKIGSVLFLAFWLQVQKRLEWGIRTFKDDSGNLPGWFCGGFDLLVSAMWIQHDMIFAYLFGRGDGL